jgi:hypothetical protein
MENFELKGLHVDLCVCNQGKICPEHNGLKVSEIPNEFNIYSAKDGKKICTLKPDNNIKPFFSENYEDVRKKFNELE